MKQPEPLSPEARALLARARDAQTFSASARVRVRNGVLRRLEKRKADLGALLGRPAIVIAIGLLSATALATTWIIRTARPSSSEVESRPTSREERTSLSPSRSVNRRPRQRDSAGELEPPPTEPERPQPPNEPPGGSAAVAAATIDTSAAAA